MKFIKTVLTMAAMVVSATTFANAETINKTVRAGTTSYIAALAVFNRSTCQSGAFPKFSSPKAQNGKFVLRKIKQRVPKGKRCAGNSFYYAAVYYTPKSGFRGKDKGRFSLSFPQFADGQGHASKRYRVNLTVK